MSKTQDFLKEIYVTVEVDGDGGFYFLLWESKEAAAENATEGRVAVYSLVGHGAAKVTTTVDLLDFVSGS